MANRQVKYRAREDYFVFWIITWVARCRDSISAEFLSRLNSQYSLRLSFTFGSIYFSLFYFEPTLFNGKIAVNVQTSKFFTFSKQMHECSESNSIKQVKLPKSHHHTRYSNIFIFRMVNIIFLPYK